VTERGIIFSGESVRAILEGRKTQTRRVVDPKLYVEYNDGEAHVDQSEDHFGEAAMEYARCPYGSPGTKLWVRETWSPDPCYENEQRVCYRATAADESCIRWKSPLFMPRWASRITLEVTEVSVQRLQDISEEDARAEGIPAWTSPEQAFSPRVRFHELWDSINGKKAPWASNPWCWAVSFRKVG
jgi:hypothetical protein